MPNHSKNQPPIRHRVTLRHLGSLAGSLACLLTLLIVPDAAHGACNAHSALHRVALLEMYTSEGCNSCPPADRWLGQLPATGFDRSRVVPLAFHVDYWNNLGWRDRFSSPQFSARQRAAATRGRATFVYTPQFLLNGRDFRPLASMDRFQREIELTNRSAPAIELALEQQRNGKSLIVTIDAVRAPGGPLEVFVAVFESELETEVRTGENAGKILRHDFVVRELKGPVKWSNRAPLRSRLTFELDSVWRDVAMGVVAFAQDPRTGDVLQVLATSLCPG